jgi:sterol desaturase/sphingolipid hydroxylase (fatty acid hydroxylase superfamily)
MSNRLFKTNRDESVRLFRNNFLEYFSHIHPATPAVVYIPVTAIISYYGLSRTTPANFIIMFLLGILIWSLFEYLIHRFAFHYRPKTDFGKRIHFLSHGVHHDYPRDRTRLVMPLLVSLPLAVVLYFIFLLLFGPDYFLPAFAGLLIGYVAYDSIHYATHHWKMTGPVGRYLKDYHLKHHYVDPDSGYGVSNPFWDYVFFTVPVRDKEKIKE